MSELIEGFCNDSVEYGGMVHYCTRPHQGEIRGLDTLTDHLCPCGVYWNREGKVTRVLPEGWRNNIQHVKDGFRYEPCKRIVK